jgi:hypothetical protein
MITLMKLPFKNPFKRKWTMMYSQIKQMSSIKSDMLVLVPLIKLYIY